MDLSFLFTDAIQEVMDLNPGYDDHASDVWLVKTDRQEVVVRTSRMTQEPDNDFWWGCKQLFGIDPRQVHNLAYVNNTLSERTPIPVPMVLKKGKKHSREYVVVEKLEGQAMVSFIGQSSTVMQSLGEGMAKIHQHQEKYIGNPSGSFQIELGVFHKYLSKVMTQLVSKFYQDDEQIQRLLPEINKLLEDLPAPELSTFVLVDIDPTQFLSNGNAISGLVDTEAYVVAPRELDFIGLEYVLDQASANDFRNGYEKVLQIPDLTNCRAPYRYLYRLLSVQGDVEIDKWMGWEELF
ncbi:phosphotransferase [Lentibacillus sediminis]|uniref:phosphotransferase n=1 Tax=Lentibacillus sediminis TaxID=1940529 RepID=UPI000C1C14A3|nr:phosphotransferase [Lentibacillus sediminis]